MGILSPLRVSGGLPGLKGDHDHPLADDASEISMDDYYSAVSQISPQDSDSSDGERSTEGTDGRVPSSAVTTASSATSPGPSPRAQQFRKLAFAKREKLLEFAFGEEGWKDCGKLEGVQLGRKDFPSGPSAVRGRLNFGKAYTANQVADYVSMLDTKHEWDSMFDKGSVLHSFGEGLSVVHQVYKPQMGTAGRDFVALEHRYEDPTTGRVTITNASIDWSKPAVPGLVRGDILVAGLVLQPLADGTLEATYINRVDVKGNVPHFVVRMVQTKQPTTLKQAKNILDKRGLPHSVSAPASHRLRVA
ncbi:unnamed protein product [Vitrella brassicaformis CCMP3155]|uniref:START domain-containing protein n=1 Tax=Vitrella brassicaformis (strain CCMP3155) TaxID=1169540 RepID=A0A0G4F2Q5_VITBC|nr:unnamed protein product [Vitrella brassicaformis CCMP3155]|mmetsp:Transcript_47506/g.118703  ORF Transcript_47506/g.118703 Transcript_47506/m.118703 type:complete len:304 (-) Transcript_47506:1804-2715(-)|eukprot:CEM06498.1 unnamed protein product [Vitrella brassicaformis CCMP3155]